MGHGSCFWNPDYRNRDICIESDSDININISNNLGKCYQHPNYRYGSNEAQSILAGTEKFQTIEIEVYHLYWTIKNHLKLKHRIKVKYV